MKKARRGPFPAVPAPPWHRRSKSEPGTDGGGDTFCVRGVGVDAADILQDRPGEQVHILQHRAQRAAQENIRFGEEASTGRSYQSAMFDTKKRAFSGV